MKKVDKNEKCVQEIKKIGYGDGTRIFVVPSFAFAINGNATEARFYVEKAGGKLKSVSFN